MFMSTYVSSKLHPWVGVKQTQARGLLPYLVKCPKAIFNVLGRRIIIPKTCLSHKARNGVSYFSMIPHELCVNGTRLGEGFDELGSLEMGLEVALKGSYEFGVRVFFWMNLRGEEGELNGLSGFLERGGLCSGWFGNTSGLSGWFLS